MTEQEFIDKAAIAAMQALITREKNPGFISYNGEKEREEDYANSARRAYAIAWAMLEARRTGGNVY